MKNVATVPTKAQSPLSKTNLKTTSKLGKQKLISASGIDSKSLMVGESHE